MGYVHFSHLVTLLFISAPFVQGQQLYYYYYVPDSTGTATTTNTQQLQYYYVPSGTTGTQQQLYYYYYPSAGTAGTAGTTGTTNQQYQYYYYPTGTNTGTSSGQNYYYYYYQQPATGGTPSTGTTAPYYATQANYCSYSPYTNFCSTTSCYYSETMNNCCLTYYASPTGNGQVSQVCSCASTVTCAAEPGSTVVSTTAPTSSTEATTASSAAPASSTAAPASTSAASASSTAAPASSTAASASSSAAPASTSAAPASTSAAPASTPAAPASTSAAPATTSAAPDTTPAKRSLCESGLRLLNGDPVVDDCEFPGAANITSQNGEISSCNAVLAPVTVNGQNKPAFLTSGLCRQMIAQLSNPSNIFEINIGSQTYPIQPPLFNLVEGPDGTAFIEVDDRYMNLLNDLGTCQTPACPYDPSTMDGLVDMNDCKMGSYGASSPGLTQDGLNEVALVQNEGGCASLPDMFGAANTMCYQSASGQNVFCAGDSGAPVYCKASTDEWILIGVASFQPTCDTSPEVKVLPVPN